MLLLYCVVQKTTSTLPRRIFCNYVEVYQYQTLMAFGISLHSFFRNSAFLIDFVIQSMVVVMVNRRLQGPC